MNVAVVGMGGVGGYFGGRLCQPSLDRGDGVYFVARGSHLREIQKNGLLLRTTDYGEIRCRPTLATDDFQDLPDLDVCLLCVKSYDLQTALDNISPKISRSSHILPLLNGVDIYDRVRKTITTGNVYPACVYVGTHIEGDGIVAQQGGACKILFGRDPRSPDGAPAALISILDGAGIAYGWFDGVYPEIWMKYIFIAAFGLVSAAYDKTLGQIMETARLSDHVQSIMAEISAIAQRQGVRIPADAVAESFGKGRAFAYDTKTSFQRDVERAEKRDERDLFGGTITRLGQRWGIPTPITAKVCAQLEARKPERMK